MLLAEVQQLQLLQPGHALSIDRVRSYSLHFLDWEGGSQKATLVVLVVGVIS